MGVNIALSHNGISVLYRCCNMLLRRGKKCADKNTDKCLRCKYAKAEMSAYDATRLMNKGPDCVYADQCLPSRDGEYLVYGRDAEDIRYHWFVAEYDANSAWGEHDVVVWAELPGIKWGEHVRSN